MRHPPYGVGATYFKFSQLMLDEDTDEVLVLMNVVPVVLFRIASVLPSRQGQRHADLTFNVRPWRPSFKAVPRGLSGRRQILRIQVTFIFITL